MKHVMIALLLAATLAGCTDEPASDDHVHPEDDEDHSDHTGMQNETMKPVHKITIEWTGTYPAVIGYDKPSVTVPANTTIELTFKNSDTPNNPAGSHDLVIEGIEGAGTKVIAPGQTDTITFESGEPRATKFYCSVGSHRSGGMEGDFIIE